MCNKLLDQPWLGVYICTGNGMTEVNEITFNDIDIYEIWHSVSHDYKDYMGDFLVDSGL